MTPNATIRIFGFVALIVAGSCSVTPDRDPTAPMLDGAANNPVMVEPSFQSIKLNLAGGATPAAMGQLDAFITSYRDHGTGSISVSAPASPTSQGMIDFVAGRINQMGIGRDKILVSTHDARPGDMLVEVNYISYQARTKACGDWSDNLALTLDNRTPRNFGCAVQQNFAANIADPRDLLGPRTMDMSSGVRRSGVITLYEAGKPTQAEKKTVDAGVEQSAGASKVGQ
jgi:pilus assembly protein CpaD